MNKVGNIGRILGIVLVTVSLIFWAQWQYRDKVEPYEFSTLRYDDTTLASTQVKDSLYHRGVTIRHFAGQDYYIANTSDRKITATKEDLQGHELLDWGPVTVNRDILSSEDPNIRSYRMSEVHNSKGEYTITVTISLVNKYPGTLVYAEYKPTWVSLLHDENTYGAFPIGTITETFAGGRNYGDTIELVISWKTTEYRVKDDPLLISVDAVFVTKDHGKFRQFMTFKINNNIM